MIGSLVLPRGVARLARVASRLSPTRPRFFSRLLGEGWVAP
jgi:hypothetical protein